MSENNPLKAKIRPIKIYIRLPSKGHWNKEGVDFTNNGEVPVRAMTATDELLLRNPDALLNGDAVERLVKSCVPEIHNIRETPMNDIDSLLLAIKYASFGDHFDYPVKCPKCGQENHIEKSIRSMLDFSKTLPEVNLLQVADGVEFLLKPYSFENSNKSNILDFENQKRLAFIQASYSKVEGADPKQIDGAEKIARREMTELFKSMADFTLGLMTESVIQINVTEKNEADGKEIKSVVTNRDHIKEYIWNMDPVSVEKVKNKMKEIMKYGVDKSAHVTCVNPECKHEWDMEVGFDQSNFFAPTLRQ